MAAIKTKEYIRRAKLLRKWPILQPDGSTKNVNLIDGFKAKDGFDLRKANDFSPSQKAKITRSYNEIDELLARQVHLYKPRKKAHLEQAQKYAQHEVKLKGLKYALIPTYGELTPKIRFDKKDKIHVKYGGVDRVLIELDPFDLVEDVEETVKTAVAEQTPHANAFMVQAGKYEIPQVRSEKFIIEDIQRLITKYDLPEDNHDWRNWLHGVVAFTSDELEETDDLIEAKFVSGREYRKKRKSEKRKLAKEKREDKIGEMWEAIQRRRSKNK